MKWGIGLAGGVVVAAVLILVVYLAVQIIALLDKAAGKAPEVTDEFNAFWNWSFDENVALADRLVAITLITTALSLAVAVFSVGIAVSTTSFAKETEKRQRRAESNRKRETYPHVRVRMIRLDADDNDLVVRLHNTGGPARDCLFLLAYGEQVYRINALDLSSGQSLKVRLKPLEGVARELESDVDEALIYIWGSVYDVRDELLMVNRYGRAYIVQDTQPPRRVGVFTTVYTPAGVPDIINRCLSDVGVKGMTITRDDY